ncbi:hypothetical protein Tco_0776636 [Tanacetum coccineum]
MARFIKIAMRLRLVDDLKMLKITMSNTSSRNKLNPEINDHYNIFTRESQEYELKTKDEAYLTEGILDIRGIYLYNTSNEAFKILDDKVPLKLDLTDDFQNEHKPKTIVSAGGSNINPDHAILMDKFDALSTKINFEFLKIRKDLNKIRDGRIDDEGNHNSDYHLKNDTPMCEPHESNYV